jgi:hypothetical protein
VQLFFSSAPTLRDVTFIYDGNREYVAPGKINFEIMGTQPLA